MTSYLQPDVVLRNYFHAKDENRTHVLGSAFVPAAELAVVNETSTIEFPARTVGREAIADVLVRDFGRTYENVYSFYLGRPAGALLEFECPWLVAMSEKQSRSTRVGCGRYFWVFDRSITGLATRLTITIDAMQVLPSSELAAVLEWVGRLSYPWCSASSALRSMPEHEALAPVAKHLRGYEGSD
ncbi:MAG TPA: hypothetical protein VFU71_20360 [Burkholderiaceae bacterium]|nr:hypothetical protein [Burkholderiaceae bacterium]